MLESIEMKDVEWDRLAFIRSNNLQFKVRRSMMVCCF